MNHKNNWHRSIATIGLMPTRRTPIHTKSNRTDVQTAKNGLIKSNI